MDNLTDNNKPKIVSLTYGLREMPKEGRHHDEFLLRRDYTAQGSYAGQSLEMISRSGVILGAHAKLNGAYVPCSALDYIRNLRVSLMQAGTYTPAAVNDLIGLFQVFEYDGKRGLIIHATSDGKDIKTSRLVVMMQNDNKNDAKSLDKYTITTAETSSASADTNVPAVNKSVQKHSTEELDAASESAGDALDFLDKEYRGLHSKYRIPRKH